MAAHTQTVNVVLVAALLMTVAMTASQLIHVVHAQTSCQTSSSSPSVADANTCVQYIRNLGASTSCCQQNSPSGSCTTMYTSGTASVDICGGANACTTCANAGDQLNIILATCPSDNRVAGTQAASGFTFRIRHS